MIVCAAVVGPQVSSSGLSPPFATHSRLPPLWPPSPSLTPPTPTPIPPQNNPLFLRAFAPTDDLAKLHCVVHCALDAVEERVLLRRAPGEVPDLYLGLLYPTEEYRVYGCVGDGG
jgi:hypothetical protein